MSVVIRNKMMCVRKKDSVLHTYIRGTTMTNNENSIIYDGLEKVSDAARFLGVSRSFIYKLLSAGVLPSVKIGNSRRLPIRSVRDLAAACLTQQPRLDEHT